MLESFGQAMSMQHGRPVGHCIEGQGDVREAFGQKYSEIWNGLR